VAVSAMKTAINFIKDEIKIVCVLLKRHKDVLSSNSFQKNKTMLTPSPKRRSMVGTFKDSMALVQISDNEFHTEVDPAFKNNKKKPGRVGKFGACVKISVDSVVAKLRATDDYSPIFLCDETMGIDKYSLAIGEPFLHPSARSRYREQFRIQLRDCVQKQSLTCESQIEKAYYNKTERALKLKDLCIYCGSGADDEEDDDTFLLRLPQLQERLMTDGYVCFPMCLTCVKNGKKVVKAGKKDTAQARVERIARLGN
jgi:hypothetical protein